MKAFDPARNVEMERSLIGACLLAGVVPPCPVSDFSSVECQSIAGAMAGLGKAGLSIDVAMVADKLSDSIPIVTLAELMDSVSNAKNVDSYAKIVRQYAAFRRVQLEAFKFLYAEKNGNMPKILAEFSRIVSRSADFTGMDDGCSLSVGMKEYSQELDRYMEGDHSDNGIQVHIGRIDDLLNGLRPHQLMVIAARTSMGKTAFALNLAVNVAKRSTRVQIFSLEMSRKALMQRMIAREAEVPLDAIVRHNPNQDEYLSVSNAMADLARLNIQIFDRAVNELDIVSKAVKHKPDMVIVDYLQRINPSSKTGNANYDYGEVSKAMKDLAVNLGIPVILLSQLNRSNEKENRKPRLSDLRDSGQIEQDADIVIMLHADDHTIPERLVIVGKNRQGRCGMQKMKFVGEFQDFQPITMSY